MKFNGAEIIGHRGAAGICRENTRDAFDWAWKNEVGRVETDIPPSADGQLVICHNAHIGENAIAITEYQELLDLSGGTLLLLHDLLDEYGRKLLFNLEIKDPACAEGALDAVLRRNLEDTILFSSFHHPTIRSMAKNDSSCGYAPLIASRPLDLRSFLGGFDGFHLLVADCDFCDKSMITECRESGFELYLYNVHEKQRATTFVEAGVTGLIVDRPDLFSSVN
jgi:glycerophosphoryl diester phosphodiesterase